MLAKFIALSSFERKGNAHTLPGISQSRIMGLFGIMGILFSFSSCANPATGQNYDAKSKPFNNPVKQDKWRFVERGTKASRLGADYENYKKIYGEAKGYQGGGHGHSYAYKDAAKGCCIIYETAEGGIENIILTLSDNAPADAINVNLMKEDAETEKGIKLGLSQADVKKMLGDPHEVIQNGDKITLCYRATDDECPYVSLCYDGYYTFQNDKLVEVHLHDG